MIFPALLSAVDNIPPPTISHGHWHSDKARNLDRLLLMTDADVDIIRARILQGNVIFRSIYSNNYRNRDGAMIGGLYQNAIRTTYTNRMDRAVLAKNKAFVALMGIRTDGDFRELVEMTDSEIDAMREEALALLRDFDNSAWSDQDRPNPDNPLEFKVTICTNRELFEPEAEIIRYVPFDPNRLEPLEDRIKKERKRIEWEKRMSS